jgi:hypothetical protein
MPIGPKIIAHTPVKANAEPVKVNHKNLFTIYAYVQAQQKQLNLKKNIML